jgi:SHS family lactate transporter-like MFS transporter
VNAFGQLRGLTGRQWRAFTASFMGWMLDAFDYFILVMVAGRLAEAFHTTLTVIATGFFLTLAFRPVGALLFGLMADRYGRRPALMASVLLFAVVELLTGFAPNLTTFFILRAIFGIGMGGEWGVGASLAMESVPAESRGLLSGILQQGYPLGYLLAAVMNGFAYPYLGWRGMFMVGAIPAVLVVFIRMGVHESPAWVEERTRPKAPGAVSGIWPAIRANWPLFLYMVALMTAFNAFSHGAQDNYPSGFLEKARHLPLRDVTRITVIYNIGAIIGGILFGALSQKIGRRKAIAMAALLVLPMIPLWVGNGSAGTLAVGAFLIQMAVQGAWGVVPAHLNELSPASVRGTFPGLAYQLGNLGASFIPKLEPMMAEGWGRGWPFALGWVVGIGAVVLAAIVFLGPEARDARMSADGADPQPHGSPG